MLRSKYAADPSFNCATTECWTGINIHTIMSSNLQAWWALIWNVVVISSTFWGCDNLSRYFYVYNVALLPKFQCNKPVLPIIQVNAFMQQRKNWVDKDKICGLPRAPWSNEADRGGHATCRSVAISVYSLHLCSFGDMVLLVVAALVEQTKNRKPENKVFLGQPISAR